MSYLKEPLFPLDFQVGSALKLSAPAPLGDL